jgi:DNA transformation protein
MTNTADFVAYVVETMRPARASARAMFGGHGIRVDGLFVAIVIDDVLYFKCDPGSAPLYDALGLPQFEYATKHGKSVALGYRRAPDEALESPAEMQAWLHRAMSAALASPARSKAAKAAKAAARKPRASGRKSG